jgi:GntR family transcriptional regulator
VKIDPNDSRPPYRQLADDLRRRIQVGEFPPGTPLPSIRRLAVEYEIAAQTVQSGLKELRNAGLVIAQQGRAFYVRDPRRSIPETSGEDAGRLDTIEAGLRNVQEKITALEEDNEDLRALIMDLYGRIEQPYPRETPKGVTPREQAN